MSQSSVIHQGDALEVLRTLDNGSVNCCVTSPPFYSLRDYDVAGQIGLEDTAAEYVARLVDVFREVRRVLRVDGSLWLNLGDSYCSSGKGHKQGPQSIGRNPHYPQHRPSANAQRLWGLQNKSLMGIPWRVALGLQEDGWILRSDIIWEKPNALPESVRDRPTKSHEYLFLLTKSRRYYYDQHAIREPVRSSTIQRYRTRTYGEGAKEYGDRRIARINPMADQPGRKERIIQEGRNKRTVWSVSTRGFNGAHFATYPEALITPCVLAGCPLGGVVLDPFAGSGTTGVVALRHGRWFVGIELNAEYVQLARERLS